MTPIDISSPIWYTVYETMKQERNEIMKIYVITETVRTDVGTATIILPKCYDKLKMAKNAMIKAKNAKLVEWTEYWRNNLNNPQYMHIAEYGDDLSVAIEDSQDRAEWEIHTVELSK